MSIAQPEIKHHIVYAFLFSPKIYCLPYSEYKVKPRSIYKLFVWFNIPAINVGTGHLESPEYYLSTNKNLAEVYDKLYDIFYPQVFIYSRKINLLKLFHYYMTETDWKIICQMLQSENIQSRK